MSALAAHPSTAARRRPTPPRARRRAERGDARALGSRAWSTRDAIDRARRRVAMIDKSELLAHARACAVATYGTARECERWNDLRTGTAALACCAWAYPESYEAVVLGTLGRGRDDDGRRARTRAGSKAPWDAVRGILARERVPANALDVEATMRGEFQATFDLFAVLYWQRALRRRAVEGGDDDALEISFARRLNPGTRAYCTRQETRDRATRLARKQHAATSREASGASATGVASSIQKADSTVDTVVKEPDIEPRAAMSATTQSMTIEQWETLTEVRWELEKTKELLEARERELERAHTSESPTATRRRETKMKELMEQLAHEREERERAVRERDALRDELKHVRTEVSALMSAAVLSQGNMESFNSVDVRTHEGRAIAQTMIDVMDCVRKANADVQRERADRGVPSPSAHLESDGSLSPSFIARMNTFDLSESSVRRDERDEQEGTRDENEIEHFTTASPQHHRSASRESGPTEYDSLDSVA